MHMSRHGPWTTGFIALMTVKVVKRERAWKEKKKTIKIIAKKRPGQHCDGTHLLIS